MSNIVKFHNGRRYAQYYTIEDMGSYFRSEVKYCDISCCYSGLDAECEVKNQPNFFCMEWGDYRSEPGKVYFVKQPKDFPLPSKEWEKVNEENEDPDYNFFCTEDGLLKELNGKPIMYVC